MEVVSGVIVTGTTVSVPVVQFLAMHRELGSERYILVMVMITCYTRNQKVSLSILTRTKNRNNHSTYAGDGSCKRKKGCNSKFGEMHYEFNGVQTFCNI